MKKQTEVASRQCEQCKLNFFKKPRSSISLFSMRKYCSKTCQYKAQVKLVSIACAGCCRNFVPERRRQRFCSVECNSNLRRKNSTPRYYVRCTADGRRMLEHRYVMELHIGRTLHKWEQVHHKNGNTLDNSTDNLELWTRQQPTGQRVLDMIDFYITHYRGLVVARLSETNDKELSGSVGGGLCVANSGG